MEPKPHQQRGISFIQERKQCALWWEPRVGKSLAALRGVLSLTEGAILILAPKSALVGWADLCFDQGISYWRYGSKVPPKDYRVVLCNYETAWRHRAIAWREWPGIIFDESIRLANWNAKQASVWSFHRVPDQVRVLLSGAPAPESPIQFAHQMFVCRGSWFGHDNIFSYIKAYWEFDQLRKRWVCPFPAHESEIIRRIRLVGQSLKRSEAGIQDSKLYSYLRIGASPWMKKQAKALDLAKNEAEAEGKTMPGYLMRLQRICSGYDEGGKIVDRTKLDAAIEHCKEKAELEPDYGCVLFSRFRGEVEALAKGLGCDFVHGGVKLEDRAKAFAKFQAGARFIVCQETTAKMGVDLSRASELLYVSNTWSGDDRIQSEERATNMNKPDPVQVSDMCIEGLDFNIDYAVAKAVRNKKDFSEASLFA